MLGCSDRREVMLKIQFAVPLFVLFSVFPAAASANGEVNMVVDGKAVQVTDIDNNFFSSEKRISSNDCGLVYVEALNGLGPERLKNAETTIRDRFVQKGFKTTENADDATIRITFSTGGSLSMKDADKAAEHSALPNSNQVRDNAGAFIGSALAAGPGGAVAFLAGGLFGGDSKTNLVGNVRIKQGDKQFIDTPVIKYRFEKGKEASEDVVLKALTDLWINRYIKMDVVARTETAVAVSAASVVTEVKP